MNNTRTIIWVIVVVVVVGAVYFIYRGGTKPVSAEPIKIGFIGPLTGEMANIGTNVKAAVEIAVEEINTAGGINRHPVEVIYEDDKCIGPNASNAVSKLINVDKASAILGSVCSSATLSAAPIAEQAKVVLLSYCSTAPAISQAGDYIFRDVPSDLFQAKFAAKYLYGIGKHKAAIVYVNNDWGLGLKNSFSEAFKNVGGQIVLEEGYNPDSKDLRSQLTKVKNAKADVLYFPSFSDGAIAGLKQAKQLGVSATIFGADAWDDGRIWRELGSTGEGAMFTVIGTNPNESFKAKMAQKLGSDELIYCSNYAYDGLKILAKVMSQVGTKGEDIKNALYKVEYNGGVSSKQIKFDSNGDPTEANYIIKVVRDGKSAELK